MSKNKKQSTNLKANREPSKTESNLKSSQFILSESFRKVIRIMLMLLLIGSAFVLLLQLVPNRGPLNNKDQDRFLALVPITNENRLIIPKISVNSIIYQGNSNVLDKGTWHRFPERGNPEIGGNFILAAHRYIFSFIPQRVSEKSVLYNIDKLNVGDKIYINWQNKRYEYVISKKYKVSPSSTEIESQSDKPKLTLYSCTKEGQADGREVVEATPVK